MQADIQGALNQLNKSWRSFEHKGKPMTKSQVEKVLKYALSQGYKTTAELSDDEVDLLIDFKSPNIETDALIYGQNSVTKQKDWAKF